MGNSFQDQFLKAGLVSKEKAHKTKKQKQKQRKQEQHGNSEIDESIAEKARDAQAEKVVRDRELNQARQDQGKEKEIAAQIIQLVSTTQIDCAGGEQGYNFTDGTKIKTIHLPELIHKQLSKGQLAIARHGDVYAVIPLVVAEKIRSRDASILIEVSADSTQTNDEDDPYAEFEIPDDLMW